MSTHVQGLNLIDILKNILYTKNELREILSENEDFSRLPTSIHNYLVDLYNEGYVIGYGDTYERIVGVRRYVDSPKSRLDYNINDTYYDPYTVSALTDIMRNVLNYRIQMKDSDKLDTENDYFPDYPDYLRHLISITYDEGYDDGCTAAEGDILPSEDVHVPSFVFDSTSNTFSITSDQENVSIWFKDGVNGKPIQYTSPVTITETMDIYYYAVLGLNKSDPTVHYLCSVNTSTTQIILPPDINVWDNKVILSSQEEDSTIMYCIEDGDWDVYRGPIVVSEDWENVTVRARNYKRNTLSITNSTDVSYTDSSSVEIVHPSSPTFEFDGNTLTFTCSTEDATIMYSIDSSESEDYSEYTSPITIDSSCVVFYYSVLDDVESERLFVPINYVPPVSGPDTVRFQGLDYSNGLRIYCITPGSHVWYRYGWGGDFTEVQSNQVFIEPTSDGVITAYSSLNGINSEIQSYEYNYFSNVYVLSAPVFSQIGNYVTISRERGTIYYSLDTGEGPGEEKMYSTAGAVNGIPVTEFTDPLIIRARCVDVFYSDGGAVPVYSPTSTFIARYNWDDFNYKDEYFTVQGASEIRFYECSNYSYYPLRYSYDKVSWYTLSSYTTGLDPTKKIFLASGNGNGNLSFYSLRFGEGDSVTVSGNINSLMWGDEFRDYDTVYEYTTSGDTYGFQKLFEDSTRLVDAGNLVIPTPGFGVKDRFTFNDTFKGCTSLVTAPKTLLFNTLCKSCCRGMFSGCTSLIYGPSFNFISLDQYSCYEMFSGCTSLKFVGSFNITSSGLSSLENIFNSCSSLETVDFRLSSTGERVCYQAFKDCVSLTGMGISLPSLYTAPRCYESMFSGCSGLTSFSSLPANDVDDYSYQSMFEGCSSLYEFDSIDATRVSTYSLRRMFKGCSSLVSAPELKFYSLVGWNDNGYLCLEEMFCDCVNLSYIKCAFLTDPASGYYTRNWVLNVSDYGLFEQDEDALWNNVSVNGIPLGWVCSNFANQPGVITSITNDYDVVSITCNNGNDIYYSLNNSENIEDWIKYTGPFTIPSECIVYAKCISNRGVWGETEWVIFNISSQIPLPILDYKNNYITLSSPADYEYQKLYIKIYNHAQSYTIMDWTEYTEPILITTHVTVHGKGLRKNGEYSQTVNKSIYYAVSTPELTCTDNVVHIVGPTEDSLVYWKYSTESGYRQFSNDFTISEDCTIVTFARLWDSYNAQYIDSEPVSYDCVYSSSGESYTLQTPILLRQSNDSNIILLKYQNVVYSSYSGDDILYRINEGDWDYYTHGIYITENSTIQVQAVHGQDHSGVGTYYFEYIPEENPVTLPGAPTINIVTLSGYDYAQITNTSGNGNEYRLVGVQGIPPRQTSGGWTQYKDEHPVSLYSFVGTIYARSYVLGTGGVRYYGPESYRNYGASSTVSTPVISFSNNTITITCSTDGADIYYSFDGVSYSLYTSSISINSSVRVYAKGVKEGMNDSDTTSQYCQYVEPVLPPVSDPVITCSNNTVTITTSTDGATVYYSYDEINWSTYSGGISISSSVTVYAKAIKSGMSDSNTVSQYCQYIAPITADALTFTNNSNSSFKIYWFRNGNFSESWLNDKELEYDIDWGHGSHSLGTLSSSIHLDSYITVPAGCRVSFKIQEDRNDRWYAERKQDSSMVYCRFVCESLGEDYYTAWWSGNVMSLLYHDDYNSSFTISEPFALYGLFNLINGNASIWGVILPATTLSVGCYADMFSRCSKLGSISLPATYLPSLCYANMFQGCYGLNTIKCYATSKENDSTLNWTSGVSATGIFYKNSGMSSWSTGVDGIPSGWTVQNI